MPPPREVPIGLVLANTAKAVSRAFDDALTAAGGSRPMWLVLLALQMRQHGSQVDLAAEVGIRDATLTHHLNAMEARGLVTRERDPANRRTHQVRLTDEGRAMFFRLASAAQGHDRRLRAGFGDGELVALREALGRLQANVAG
ncbi:MAG TPA: MarR family winged helix-turn-helix transcriptional regulator [Actinomycetota bacterium]|nr:MarR family winged helix-turn-helix transcriptional regulator [Actinomycetota bacterium]